MPPIPGRARVAAQRGSSGFSLIEMMMAMVLFLTVLGIAFDSFSTARQNLASESGALEAQQAARISLDEMALTIQQAGYGTTRSASLNRARWQRTIVYAGSHALAFNADIDSAVGPISSSTTLTFPDATTYAGEGAAATTSGAETYVYTLDANNDGSITQADRSGAASGVVNPAAETQNPLDYALFRRVYGYDGTAYGGTLAGVSAFLYTNATSSDLYPDGTSPDPLFVYYLTEDLNADGTLADAECVVTPCPPTSARDPQLYLWGDTDFNGVLSETEKSALRPLRVGSPTWSGNRLVSGGAYPTTTLSVAVAAGASKLKVANASAFTAGEHFRLGSGGSADLLVVSAVTTSVTPHEITLSKAPDNAHSIGETVAVLDQTLLRAIRAVRINFDAITPRADRDSSTASAAVGRAGHVGTRGSGYRVRMFERRIDLMNMRSGG